MAAKKQNRKIPPGHKLIFCRYKRTKSGQVLDARAYGHKAWPILVKIDSSNE